ncbi:MAG: class I SAM-dependent methyltransferase [Proteobacteria bacterium]|nr:class I SAM-dependent methyltransferase [Pseudomonadota bacterium]
MMAEPSSASGSILQDVERYYSAKARQYGATALGVDWNSPMSQRLRFVQLLKVVDWAQPSLSLHDLGCGYGAMLEHIEDRHAQADIQYVGTDISDTMIRLAQRRWKKASHARFALSGSSPPEVDYTVASGVFNVCLGHAQLEWERYVTDTLQAMSAASRRGFAVNFMRTEALVVRPDARGQLYGVDAARWIEHCRQALDCDVELVANYGLPEFTLLARSRSGA